MITLDEVEKLKPFLPAQFWDNRDFFFYEGMKLEIGPTQRDYAPGDGVRRRDREVPGPAEDRPRRQPRELHRRQALSRRHDRLQGGSAGRREDHVELRLRLERRRRALELLLLLLGSRRAAARSTTRAPAKTIVLSHRVEQEYLEGSDGDIFRGEKRKNAFGVRGGRALRRARHHAADLPLQGDGRAARPGEERRHLGLRADAAPRAPHLDRAAHRRGLRHRLHVRRPRSFAGIVPQYEWQCLGEKKIIAPDEHEGEGLSVREGAQLRPVRPVLRRRSLGAARRLDRAHEARRTRTIRITTRTSTSTRRRSSRSTPSPTTRRKSCGRSSGTTSAGARTPR